ncbi:MAG: hypothetical protein KJ592_02195 [Nanoarchaeota archaeon]|nr:hypothetical protein [Nanoarchaeota archaeon]
MAIKKRAIVFVDGNNWYLTRNKISRGSRSLRLSVVGRFACRSFGRCCYRICNDDFFISYKFVGGCCGKQKESNYVY